MLGHSKEARIYLDEDIARADFEWLEYGKIPQQPLGEVYWNHWRPRSFHPASKEQIEQHNAQVLTRPVTIFEAKPQPLRRKLTTAALAVVTSLVK